MRQALKEIAPSQRQNQDTKSLKQARNKKAIQQKKKAPRGEPSRARAWGARPGRTRARPGAELKPSQAELPPARPGSTVLLLGCLGSSDDHSRSYSDRFKNVSSTDSTHYRPMKARLKWSHQWGCSPVGNPH